MVSLIQQRLAFTHCVIAFPGVLSRIPKSKICVGVKSWRRTRLLGPTRVHRMTYNEVNTPQGEPPLRVRDLLLTVEVPAR